jgi:hypothetical protein
LKTDAVVVENGVELECVEGIGKYRIEEIPIEFKVSKTFKNDYSFEINRLEWNPNCTEVNRLLIGKAGFGKSTVIARDTMNHPSVVLLASTNKAATRLVGGQTVHNFFKMGIDNKFDKQLALKLVSNVQLIVIDEISMMSSEVYKVLYYIKMNKPDIKFMIVGDYGQLGAVNDFNYNYLKSTALKEIVDRNFEELTVNHRSDDSVLELYPKVKELTAANFSNSTNTKQHLCFTNAKRIQVNHLMMERDKKKKKKMLLIPKNEFMCIYILLLAISLISWIF